MILLTPLAALAAEVTEMPAVMAADVDVEWQGDWGFGRLTEAGDLVGKYKTTRQDLVLAPEFSPIAGLSIKLGLPYTPSWSLQWTEARRMAYDSDTGSGSMRDGAAVDAPALRGSGGTGVWMGVGLSPFNETFSLGQQSTWRIDAAFRLPTPNSRWEDVDGKRGAGNGGAAWRVAAAFSTERGPSTPWMRFVATGDAPVTVAGVDGSGAATELVVRPGTSAVLSTGIEIAASEDREKHTATRFTVEAAFGYQSWSDVPSGLFLPSVLDASQGLVVTRGETMFAQGGLGFVLDVHANFGIRFGGGASYAMPYRVESPYPVLAGPGAWAAYGTAGIEVRTKPHETAKLPIRRTKAPAHPD